MIPPTTAAANPAGHAADGLLAPFGVDVDVERALVPVCVWVADPEAVIGGETVPAL